MLDKSLNNGYIDDKPTSTVKLLAKHYFSIGQDKEQVISSIENFMEKYYPSYNMTDWQKIINKSVTYIYKYNDFTLLNVNKIEIYQEELECIKGINNIRLEKLAFVLLVYSKIYNQINKNNTNWVNSSLKDIFSDAKMAVSTKDKGLMINKLGDIGLVEVSKKVDCTNMKILFTKTEGNVAIEITDFRDIVFYYLQWIGDNIGICEGINNDGTICGRLIRNTSNRKKYCSECWKNREKELWRENKRKNK